MKKRKSNLKRLVTALLGFSLLAFMTTPIFADYEDGALTGTEAQPATAAIRKDLQLPQGVTTPNAEFEFALTKVSYNGGTTTADLNVMPAIPNSSVVYEDTDTETAVSGVVTIPKETTNIFANAVWTAPGLYVYTLAEVQDNNTLTAGEIMNYSAGTYELTVIVERGDNVDFFVSTIATKVVNADNDTQTPGEKVDPTPGTGGGTTLSNLVFTNSYLKQASGEDLDDSLLTIGQTVGGTLADDQFYFTHDVTITQPTVGVAPGFVYKGYVVDENDAVVTSALNGTVAGATALGDYINFTSGTAVNVKLKAGQRLVFPDMHVGATYTDTLAATTGYTYEYAALQNGVASTDEGNAGEALAAGPFYVGDDGTNSLIFTATFDVTPPTGIIIDNLPYIVLIGFAVIVVVGLAYDKKRKKVN